jgi:hypothetical protein
MGSQLLESMEKLSQAVTSLIKSIGVRSNVEYAKRIGIDRLYIQELLNLNDSDYKFYDMLTGQKPLIKEEWDLMKRLQKIIVTLKNPSNSDESLKTEIQRWFESEQPLTKEKVGKWEAILKGVLAKPVKEKDEYGDKTVKGVSANMENEHKEKQKQKEKEKEETATLLANAMKDPEIIQQEVQREQVLKQLLQKNPAIQTAGNGKKRRCRICTARVRGTTQCLHSKRARLQKRNGSVRRSRSSRRR